MSFAALEQRTAASVMARMSNARAQKVGAMADFPVVFDRAYLETQVGAGASRPVITALDADVQGFVSDTTQLVLRGVTYSVIDLQPDGTGMTLLVLEAA